MIFTEKYRPKQWEDVIGLPEGLYDMVERGMPHFLFIGPPGTGKTTVAKIIINKTGFDCLELNASDERGIDVVREKIKTFAMTRGISKQKIVLLDEFDATTRDFQTALRNLMEKYANNCKFIMTANYANKIIDPIKSRCSVFEYKLPDKELICELLNSICEKEKISITKDIIDKIINVHYPDIRKCVSKLQELKSNPNMDIDTESVIAKDVVKLLKEGKFITARQKVLDSMVDCEDLLMEIYDFIDKTAPKPVLVKSIPVFAECMKWMSTVINKNILFENFMLSLMEKIGWELKK